MKIEPVLSTNLSDPDILRLLIAQDDPVDLALMLRELKKSGLDLHLDIARTKAEFVEALNSGNIDMVLSDYRMCDWTGIDALTEVIKFNADIPVIFVTGTLGDLKAVECMRLGVTDYVLKDQIARLPMAIMRAREERAIRRSQKLAAEAVRESEAHYRTLVENAPEAIVVLDIDKGSFVDCNNNALRLFRMKREELLTRGPGELSPQFQPDGRHSISATQLWSERGSSDEISSFEWTHRNSMGVDVPCEVHLVRLESPTRNLIRGSILDITERKRSEEEVRDSEGRYRDLVNNAMYGIYWVSPDGALLDANPALVHMLGYDSVESLMAVRDTGVLFCDPTLSEKVLAEQRSDRADFTVDWKRRDGKIITVRLIGRRARDPRLKTACVEVIVEEITQRLALEKRVRQAQKFEAIGQLAGGIAHDFNNMIGAILGWAELGMDETDAATRLHRHFDKIRHQAIRAAALTRQLLAFARRQILEPRDVDLNLDVTETLSLLEKVIGSNIEVKIKLTPGLPVIRGDPTQIEQVIMNLCINARDAMPQGGRLVIETGEFTFDQQYLTGQEHAKPGAYAMLAVTDSGIGMDAATLDRIFEPFFTTKETGKGTGLGLATVYGIVRQHGGFIQVYSELSIGTTFRVYLPLPLAAGSRTALLQTEDNEPVRGGSELILVAEDHEGLRELACESLGGLGYSILTARDGEEAISEFGKHRDQIDLLLFDVVLPKINGPKAYAQISQLKPGVPVIFVTGYSADIALLQEAQQQGLTVLQKPYDPRDLARRIRDTLDLHSVRVQRA